MRLPSPQRGQSAPARWRSGAAAGAGSGAPPPRGLVTLVSEAVAALASILLLAACPEISVTPASGPQGAQQMVLDVAGSNTNFVQGTTTASFRRSGGASGIVVDDLVVDSPTVLRLTVSIPTTEPVGLQTLTVTTGSETAQTGFTVTAGPTVSLQPQAVEQGEEGAVVQVLGTNTTFASTSTPFTVVVNVPEVQVVSTSVGNDTSAELVLNVGLGAPLGVHAGAVQVHTDYQVVMADLEILPVTGRAITLSPAEGEQGQAVTVQVLGTKTDFLHGADVRLDPPDHVDVSSAAVVDEHELSVVLSLHSTAEPGLRQLVVNDGYGDISAGFTVHEDPTPPGVQLSPGYGLPGSTVVAWATGTNTSFSAGTTVAVEPADAGVTALLLPPVTSPTSAQVQLDIDPSATPQTVQVVLTTGLEEVAGNFEVLPLPSVTFDPSGWYQRESITVVVTGQDTHFVQGDTLVTVPAGSGLTVTDFSVAGEESATLALDIEADAPLGPVPISFVDSWGLPVQADFQVLPGRPAVELSPTGVPQGRQNVPVTATGYFLDWQEGPVSLAVEPACEPFLQVHDLAVSPAPGATVTFQVDVDLLAPLRSCELTFYYGQAHAYVTVALQILPGYAIAAVPSETTVLLVEPRLFAVDLLAGEVLRARVRRDPLTFVDPMLELYDAGLSQGATPLAENDDESQATVNARLVYRAPEARRYYLLVYDRLGFNTGDITLSLDGYAPEQALETGTGEDPTAAEPLEARLVKGAFDDGGGDAADFYALTPAALPPGERYLVQVLAQVVSPFETSGADVRLQLYDPAGTLGDSSSQAAWSPDPALYVNATALGYIGLVNEGPDNTAYWLNVRPVVVINEVLHDEANAWEASFVELHGEPSLDLGACVLRALAANAGGPLADPVFEVPMTGRALGPAGYHVVGHDELVPGITLAEAVPELSIDDPSDAYTTIAIVLECGGVVLDAVCYRGDGLGACEGAAAQNTAAQGLSIGRGFHVDTDRNDVDFIPQVEPSPWQRNYSEVW